MNVTDRNGVVHEVETRTTGTLMETLRELDYGVAAICGGMCSCATCHVYVSQDWANRIEPPHGDESELLSALEHRAPNSRLSCQIELTERLDGLSVTLAPEA